MKKVISVIGILLAASTFLPLILTSCESEDIEQVVEIDSSESSDLIKCIAGQFERGEFFREPSFDKYESDSIVISFYSRVNMGKGGVEFIQVPKVTLVGQNIHITKDEEDAINMLVEREKTKEYSELMKEIRKEAKEEEKAQAGLRQRVTNMCKI